ncbi:hypothetical protein AKJ09_02786 [Labilithrix luteola]|uniref:Uncharacterized protein n=1 Tax=Labilithrix luteola TaxID=1391654 RepID=A0A0K1PRG9_9BACT|nr:hypothetical protein [Labilithrix luteola]AKU96122.1 hypothetical protein AKJ09_02786 [Labilithrix luteola]
MRIFGVGTLTMLAGLAGCNAVLGLEEQPLRSFDAGTTGPVAPAACRVDGDCVPPNGCYTGRCDTVLGACAYTLCSSNARACSAGTCDPTTLTCTGEKDYGFRAGGYAVPDVTIACKDASACLAAAFPFVFIGTPSGVTTLGVESIAGSTARKIPTQVDIHPAQLVTSGRRLWILGEVQGAAPPYQLPIATIEIPSDPTIASLSATTSLVAYPFPRAVGFPAPKGALFVSFDDASQGFPTARVDAPLPSGAAFEMRAGSGPGASSSALPMFRIPQDAANGSLVASSGERLVVYRAPATFNLITTPATATATLAADDVITPAPPVLAAPRFTQGPNGTVMLGAPVVADPENDCNCTSHQRLQWVLPNTSAAKVDANQVADPEGYQNPFVGGAAACHTCNPASYFVGATLAAWVDDRRVLVAAPASDPAENRTLTAVRLLERDPIAAPATRRFSTTPADAPPGNFATDRIALASSNGLGYLLLAGSQGSGVTLATIDPRCDAK